MAVPTGRLPARAPPLHSPPVPFDFDAFEAVLLDLDGTVYYEDHALPGAVELIRRLQGRGRKYACLTNSTSSPERIAARLAHMGVRVDPDHIYTAAAAACDYVMERFGGQSPPTGDAGGSDAGTRPGGEALRRVTASQSHRVTSHPPRVFNLSTEGVADMLEGKVEWVNGEQGPCDAVICGVPVNVFATPERQRTAMLHLRRGAELVAICADRVYPSPRGLEFGVGAMSAMMAYAAGIKPVFTGKPEPFFFRELCHRLEADPGRCVLLGDNLESDIAGARGVGMKTVLLLTGVTSQEDAARAPDRLRPDWVSAGLNELL